MPSFRYRTYGLNVESEIECPDLQPWAGEPQVHVRYGVVPPRLENPLHELDWYQSSETEFLLNLEGVGRFWVNRGVEIRVEPDASVSVEQVQAYTFGSIFGIVLHQRRQLPLHASAIATEDGAVLFTGPSGYGKSTLAGEFSRRGYRIIADDICAATTLDGVPHLHPARPTILLRADSMERLNLDYRGLSPAPHNPAKRMVSVAEASDLNPVPIRAIYALNPSETSAIRLTPLTGFEKIATLTANVYRVYLLSGTDALSTYFGELTTLARSAAVVKIERPIQPFLLTELADKIEEDL